VADLNKRALIFSQRSIIFNYLFLLIISSYDWFAIKLFIFNLNK